ncbi:MAG: hypothetical protein GXY24_01530 [Bacteroidales bacterium]|nr:hypothetical protein [Bacteroidales bacterium]
MKKTACLLFAAVALLSLPSCRFVRMSDEMKQKVKDNISVNYNTDGSASGTVEASSNYVTRSEVTGEFHSLTCNIPGDVVYTPGDCAISMHGPDNVLDHITVENENGTLVVKTDGVNIRNLKKFTVNLSSPVLESLTFNGAVDFDAPRGITALDFEASINGASDFSVDGLKADKVAVTVNGAGDVEIEGLDCESIKVAVNGAGDAGISGRAARADLSISGAGDIDASRLQCPQINSKVRGIGRVKKP